MNHFQDWRLFRDKLTSSFKSRIYVHGLYNSSISGCGSLIRLIRCICTCKLSCRPQTVCSLSQRSAVSTRRCLCTGLAATLCSRQGVCLPLIAIYVICTNTNYVNNRKHSSPQKKTKATDILWDVLSLMVLHLNSNWLLEILGLA